MYENKSTKILIKSKKKTGNEKKLQLIKIAKKEKKTKTSPEKNLTLFCNLYFFTVRLFIAVLIL